MFHSLNHINYCTTHPNEPLTNYCSNINCKIGLCATCICTHTENHLEENTQPIYSNIKDLQIQINEQLQTQLQGTKEVLQRLNKVSEKIINKDEGLKQVMNTVRKQAIDALSLALNSLQTKLHSQIINDSNRCGLHNLCRVQGLKQKVKRQSQSFVQGIDDIQRHDFVFELKRLTDTVLQGGKETLKQIRNQIENNQKYMTDIKFDRQSLKQNMIKAIQNTVTLSFSVPQSIKRKIQQQLMIKRIKQQHQKQMQQQKLIMNQQNIGIRVAPLTNTVNIANHSGRASGQSTSSHQFYPGQVNLMRSRRSETGFFAPIPIKSTQNYNLENKLETIGKQNQSFYFLNQNQSDSVVISSKNLNGNQKYSKNTIINEKRK